MKRKLDSEATLKYVLPYYGTLENAFILLNCLNKRTNEIWNNTHEYISKEVVTKRKMTLLTAENLQELTDHNEQHGDHLELFEFPGVTLKTVQMMRDFTILLESLPADHLYQWQAIFMPLVNCVQGVHNSTW